MRWLLLMKMLKGIQNTVKVLGDLPGSSGTLHTFGCSSFFPLHPLPPFFFFTDPKVRGGSLGLGEGRIKSNSKEIRVE